MGYGMSYIEDNGYFTFDGVKSSDYGVWINGSGTYNAAALRYKEYNVPGRNGALTISENAFEEADHIYPAFIARNFPANVESFRNQLMSRTGYCRLTDSYHSGEFYRARYMSGLDADVAPGGVAASFNLTFRRDPRRFLLTGETVQTYTSSSGSITNPTLFPSKPLIRVYGYGTLTIGSDVITIASTGNSYTDIDSEIMDCFYGTTNVNNKVTFQSNDFPELKPGSTGISRSGNITRVEITPRWYIV